MRAENWCLNRSNFLNLLKLHDHDEHANGAILDRAMPYQLLRKSNAIFAHHGHTRNPKSIYHPGPNP